jgi:serine/threonine protein kinase
MFAPRDNKHTPVNIESSCCVHQTQVCPSALCAAASDRRYLHQRLLVHRDLKSANILLDEQMRAKVCDFGLTRVVTPAQQHVVHSPFTGVTRVLPRVDGRGGVFHDEQRPVVVSATNIAVCIVDVRGTMTKAAGTMLWMAPEVFRGDQAYTRAVDV